MRTQRNLDRLMEDGQEMGKKLLDEIADLNVGLKSLCTRVDRLLMLLAILGGGNLLIGNDLTGRMNNSPQADKAAAQCSGQSWTCAYYERLD